MRVRELVLPPEVSDAKVIGFARCYQLEHWLRELVYPEFKAWYWNAYWSACEDALNRAGGRVFRRPNHSSMIVNTTIWQQQKPVHYG